ncbi:hypothetical protein GGP41_001486 [Bipolaris sorokiniana]|nr:hypothetical protein GGP41_001486 [Bipolaris sorokiniana]
MAYYAALKFIETKKPYFDVIHMLLGYVQGANELYSSAEEMVDTDRCGSNNGVILTAAYVLFLEPENAKGCDNFILAGHSGQNVPWKEFVPIIRERFPDARNDDILISFDVNNSEAAFGKFLGSEEMIQNVVSQYVDLLESQDSMQ